MPHRTLLRCLFAAAGLLFCLPVQAQPPRKPNILFILADDLGYGDVGCYGQKMIQTPNLDRLAQEGMRFTQCYAGSTVCAPSRCVLMTGKHTGHSVHRGNRNIPLTDTTVAELLKPAGYHTAVIGKWGLGEPNTVGVPNKRGFDYFFGYLNHYHAHNYYPDYLWRNEERVEIKGNVVKDNVASERAQYAPDLFTREALAYLEKHRKEPFFLYLCFTQPHTNNEKGRLDGNGMEIPSDKPYSDRPWPQPQKNHAAMITHLDDAVGQVLAKLRELELENDTIVFFSSDNGPHKEGGADPSFFNSWGPLRGYKRDLTEGGIRVPMIVRWPGKVQAGSVNDHVWAFWDFLPTACELAGAKTPPGLDGLSIVPTLLGKPGQKQHEFLYWEFHERGSQMAVRMGNWKAIRQRLGAPLELYDLSKDIHEDRNVAADHPDVVARIEAYLKTARTESKEWPLIEKPKPKPKPAPNAPGQGKPNVLFIAVDDLNDWIGCLGKRPDVKTPNIDRLAARGTLFTRAYCVAPACNPSRAALLTGVRPSTSGVYHNSQPWRPVLKDAVTLPQHFQAHGYKVEGGGKIFHGSFNDPASWQNYFQARGGSPSPPNKPVNGLNAAQFDWGPLHVDDDAMPDFKTASWGIEFLQQKHDKPFFLAVGFSKPHLPFYAPKKYFDLYPLDKIEVPKTLDNDLDDIPPLGLKMARPHGDHASVLKVNQWKQAVQAYLACISFVDAQVGRLIDALDKSPYANNTIVVLWGDHGWHLGEKQHWRKFALWEEATRTPLIFVAPGVSKERQRCDRPVTLMDIYPTLIDLCGLKERPGLEANSLLPLLKDPKAEWQYAAVTTHGRNNHAVRTDRWRYIRYADGGEELYDHHTDPLEWKNLARDPKYDAVKKELAAYLPKVNAPDAPLK